MRQVKQLEWEYYPFQGGEEWIAEPIRGYLKYCITRYTDRAGYIVYINSSPRHEGKDLDKAKHFSQSDFETRIEECLA